MDRDAYRNALDDHGADHERFADRCDPQLGIRQQAHEREGEAPGRARQLRVADRLKAREVGEGVGFQSDRVVARAGPRQRALDDEGPAERHRVGDADDRHRQRDLGGGEALIRAQRRTASADRDEPIVVDGERREPADRLAHRKRGVGAAGRGERALSAVLARMAVLEEVVRCLTARIDVAVERRCGVAEARNSPGAH